MNIREHLLGDFSSFEQLSERSDLPVERLEALERGEAEPYLDEIAVLAETLDVDPIYFYRHAPRVVAQRTQEEIDGTTHEALIRAVDLHLAARDVRLEPQPGPSVRVSTKWKARTDGEFWARRNSVRGFDWRASIDDDPLLRHVEDNMKIPVLFWPLRGGPFGATVTLDGTLLFWINSFNVPWSQQRYTLGHELGHLLLKHNTEFRIEKGATVDEAVSAVSGPRAEEEDQAQYYASGVLTDREYLDTIWDREPTPERVAQVAAAIGASYQATLFALKHNYRMTDEGRALGRCENRSVREAFAAADLLEAYEAFESGRGRRRLPSNIPDGEYLFAALERVTAG